MSVGGKVDWLMLKRDYGGETSSLNVEEAEYGKVTKYVTLGSPIYEIEKLRRRGIHLKAKTLPNNYLKSKKLCYRNMTGKLEAKEPNMPSAGQPCRRNCEGQQAALKSVFDFYNGYDPQFPIGWKSPIKKLDTALMNYAAQLKNKKLMFRCYRKDDGSGIIGEQIGRESWFGCLRYEMIPYSPEELIDIANKEFAWCDAELLKASREMALAITETSARESKAIVCAWRVISPKLC